MLDKKSNILLIMPDQMRGDSFGLAGHPTLITPNIDAIGGLGAYFSKAYATCPSCIPARCSLMTGLYPSNSGVVGFAVPKKQFPTMPELLRNGGYHSVLVGRNMHQNPKINENPGYETCVLGSTYVVDDEYAKMLDKEVPLLGGFRGLGVDSNGWQAKPWPLPEYLHPTNWVVHQSRKIIEKQNDDRPLFLTTSFYAPHPPFIPPQHYYDRYLNMPLVDKFIGDWATPVEESFGVDNPRLQLSGNKLKMAKAGYYGSINHIDDQLTWLIKEFKTKSSQQKRPWVIVFTSDHGEMLGDHYYFRKCEPFEGSSRIPLLIQSSGLAQKAQLKTDSPVCLEDIAPTLLDFAKLSIPGQMDGKSLLPVLTGETNGVREELHCEHSPCYSKEQAFQMITNSDWKYIWRPLTGDELLFNLKKDPNELTNLILRDESKSQADFLRNALLDQLKNRPEGFVKNGKLQVLEGTYSAIIEKEPYEA